MQARVERLITMINVIATVPDMQIMGSERKTSKQGNDYIIVRAADARGYNSEFISRNLDTAADYKRGMIGTFTIALTVGKWAKAEIESFTPDKPAKK